MPCAKPEGVMVTMRTDAKKIQQTETWLAEHGGALREWMMEALFDGNEVAIYYSSTVLAMLDSIEALVARNEEMKAAASVTARNIVNQLFDEAEVPVTKRQAINDDCDGFVQKVLLEWLGGGGGDHG
jgi:hypothetical protein